MEGAAETKGGVKQDRAGTPKDEQEATLTSEKRRTFLPIEILPCSLHFGSPKPRPFGRGGIV